MKILPFRQKKEQVNNVFYLSDRKFPPSLQKYMKKMESCKIIYLFEPLPENVIEVKFGIKK